MPTPLPYLRTILETARESGRSEREISRTATGQPAAISLLKTGRIPSVERVRRLCDALDLEFYIGPRRQTSFSTLRREVRQVREARAPRVDYVGPIPFEGEQSRLDPNGIVADDYDVMSDEWRARNDARARAYEAALIGETGARHVEIREIGIHGAEGRVAFRRDWLYQHGIDPAQSVVLGVSGESMAPTVPDGSSVLVDCARRAFRDSGVFMLQTGGDLVLKRAREDADGRWVLTSDHPEWPDEPWRNDALVFGEVKWVATLLA